MKKSAPRNVYALRGTPFVLVRGHRLYARSETSNAAAGQKLVCDKPKVTEDSLTVKVMTEGPGGETVAELFGGALGTDYVEKL